MKKILVAALIAFAQPVLADCDYDKQVEVLALNMYHEARGEGLDAMQMVGETTLNRVEHSSYPDDICSVVYQRKQFSWTHVVHDHTPHETEVWEEAVEIAENLILGEIELFNNGATHFLNPNTVRVMPQWTKVYDRVGKIGNHVFYRSNRG
jgi:N-acetylmuramoyl-L-alanine amidase